MSAYMRVNVDSTQAVMSVLSTRASELGATNREARVTLYAQPELTSTVLTALEGGARVPTGAERTAIYTAGDALGWGINEALFAALPAQSS